jgi:predicted CxxxxCH...CXXCH cytochrome family protein
MLRNRCAVVLRATVAIFLGLSGCLEPRPLEEREASCGQCHGEGDSPAPPPDLLGNEERSARGVGAHAAHVARMACSECHPMPAAVDAPGHLDAAVQVVLGALARRGAGPSPAWDAEALTCNNVYCHAQGGATPAPAWTGDLTGGCGACHSAPPAPPHPQNGACETCHPPATGAAHLDGDVDLAIQSCHGCHGDAESIWPTSGAHRAHERGARVGRAVACSECHAVPATLASPGHRDGATAPAFGSLAAEGGRTPAFDASAGTCANTYCHGSATPEWSGGAAEAACGSCHGLPPPSPHPPQAWPCQYCHIDAYVGDGLVRATHIDGEVTF